MVSLMFIPTELVISLEFIELFLKMQKELQLFNILQTLEIFLQEEQ